MTTHHVRWMIKIDVAAVLPMLGWGEDELRHWLCKRNVISMVAEQGREIVGAIVYELCENKLHVGRIGGHNPEAVAVLLKKVKSKVAAHRRHMVTAYIPEWDYGLTKVFAENGFQATMTRDDNTIAMRWVKPAWFKQTAEVGGNY